ncbi:MAG: ArsR/SmtB family transcription factor [Hyphomicrobiaceae bacterium]
MHPIDNPMVDSQGTGLDRTFQALSDPTRRAILARLAQSPEVAASELAAPFDMSLPALLKHISVLENAGLVAREKRGRTVHCRLVADPMKSAMEWLATYELFWSDRLDALAAYLEDPEWTDPASRPDPASPSAAPSKPRPTASSAPGRKPRN